MKRELILSLIFTLFTISLSFNVSALVPDCGNNTILTLYTKDNSHAATFNGTPAAGTQIAICYNSYFPGNYYGSQNPWQCSGTTNLVLKLSSASNAHVSNSSAGLSYQNLCYANLRCEVQTTCTNGRTAIASLSSETNAHISNSTTYYPYKLCCARVTQPSLSGQWSDIITGTIQETAAPYSLINLTVNTINVDDSDPITITVYNESNGFLLASFTATVFNNKSELTKNLSSDILMGNASYGSRIYFNITYQGNQVKSSILNISNPPRGLLNPKWQFENLLEVNTINQTDKLRVYVETTGINNGEQITFRIYDENNLLVNETNQTVTNNIATSGFAILDVFIPNTFGDGDVFYFNASDSVSGRSAKSENITYDPDVSSSGFVNNCFVPILTASECNSAKVRINETFYSCGVRINESRCYYESANNRCVRRDFPEINNQISNDPVCEIQSDGAFSECVDGWKTLNVQTTQLAACTSGSCNPGDTYRVPCRAVALLPIFTFWNAIIAIALIVIVYLIIFKTTLFGKK